MFTQPIKLAASAALCAIFSVAPWRQRPNLTTTAARKIAQTEPFPRTAAPDRRIRPGTQPLGSPQLLLARAGVHVTNVIPAQRLRAGATALCGYPCGSNRR